MCSGGAVLIFCIFTLYTHCPLVCLMEQSCGARAAGVNANASSASLEDLTVRAVLYVPLKGDVKEPQTSPHCS